ncbi:hypothetical protein BCR34DRAFT_666684 [Clohesyomyces aquaticus]|uniref:Uncharacterized protein n=1 Tax=Clohesyomyces aquaticus TaxID=1231657 RepID=A0A1Y1Z7A4_9PLEO|nr:hypothetical protein BCR34DRAFT_666684 [Clohesyomyces aquaticus]
MPSSTGKLHASNGGHSNTVMDPNSTTTQNKTKVKVKTSNNPSLAKLASSKTNIFIGSMGDQYITIKGAYVRLLAHFSTHAHKELLAKGKSGLFILDRQKPIMA